MKRLRLHHLGHHLYNLEVLIVRQDFLVVDLLEDYFLVRHLLNHGHRHRQNLQNFLLEDYLNYLRLHHHQQMLLKMLMNLNRYYLLLDWFEHRFQIHHHLLQ